MTYTKVSLLKLSVRQHLEDLYTAAGYTIGRGIGNLTLVNDWTKLNFKLPAIAIGFNRNNGTRDTALGTEVTRNITLELNIFGRNDLEREELSDIFIEDSDVSTLAVLDYNQAGNPEIDRIAFLNVFATPNRVETAGGELENMITIVFDLDYRRDIS